MITFSNPLIVRSILNLFDNLYLSCLIINTNLYLFGKSRINTIWIYLSKIVLIILLNLKQLLY